MKKLIFIIPILFSLIGLSQTPIYSVGFSESKTAEDTIINIHDDDGDAIRLATQYHLQENYQVYREDEILGDTLNKIYPIIATKVLADTIEVDNYLQFKNLDIPAWDGYRLFADTVNHTISFYNDEADVSMQIGQEMWSRIYNNNASTILNGLVVKINGSFGKVPTVELASNDVHSKASGVLGVVTHDIETNTYGFITTIGEVRDLNTSAFTCGQPLYLSSDGQLTSTRPAYPNFVIEIGACLYEDATEGVIMVNIKGQPFDIIQNSFNGHFLESLKFTVTSDGVTTTGHLERTGGGDLTMQFSDGFSTLDCTPALDIVLTAGTATVPQTNYVYVLKSTKELTVSTSGWASEEHIRVSEVACRTSALTQTDGILRNQNWNDHLAGDNGVGHIEHINERIRRFNADWYSGAELSVNIVSASSPDDVYLSATSGKVYQMHLQDFPAQSMPTDDAHIVNHFTTPYTSTINLNTILTDALGDAITNRAFSFVIWGIQNETGENSHLMINLPIGSYLTGSDAIKDVNNYSVYTIPNQFRGVGFLIARVTFSHSSAGSGTWTLEQLQDLRGYLPNNTAGGGAAGSSGVTTYLGLTDTPNTYTANKLHGSNSVGTAMEEKGMTVTLAGTSNLPSGEEYRINNISIIEDQIVDEVTTRGASQNAIYDALLLKKNINDTIVNTGYVTNYALNDTLDNYWSKQEITPSDTSRYNNAYLHSVADTDLSPTNELNDSVRWDDSTNILKVYDAGGVKQDIITGFVGEEDLGVTVATLDGGKIPYTQLPAAVLIYQGMWSPVTNTPTLSDGIGTSGYFYKASEDGLINLGSGNIQFYIGDWVIYNGSTWEVSRDGDNVVEINGMQGIVELDTDDVPEGAVNLYYTNTRARQSISETITGIDYNNTTGVFSQTSGYFIPTTADSSYWWMFYHWDKDYFDLTNLPNIQDSIFNNLVGIRDTIQIFSDTLTVHNNRLLSLESSNHSAVTLGIANGLSLSTQQLSLGLSSTSTTGALSSTDWNTFNTKQVAYTNLSTIGVLANSSGWLYNDGSGVFNYSTPTYSDVGADPAGTDNSTNVTLAGLYDYLTLSGQQITLNQIDWLTDITNIPTTVSGYGITDVYTETEVNNLLTGYAPVTINLQTVTDNGNTTTNSIVSSSYIQATTGKFTNLTDGYIPYQNAGELDDSGLYWDGSKLGIKTILPTADLQIASNGNAAGGNILLGYTSDATNKYMAVVGTQYNHLTESEGYSLITGISSSDANTVNVGGGLVEQNSAQYIKFYTGASFSTRQGSVRMTITPDGNVIVANLTGTGDRIVYANSSGQLAARSYSAIALSEFTNDLDYSNFGAEPTITTGTTSQYWRGDKSWQTLQRSALSDGNNIIYGDNARGSTGLSDDDAITKSGFYFSGDESFIPAHHLIHNNYNSSNNVWTQIAIPYATANNQVYFRKNDFGTIGSWIKIWNANNDGSGSGLDADLLDGINTGVGAWSSKFIPYVNTDGTFEIGKYLDFHADNALAYDYDVRLYANSGAANGLGTLTINAQGGISANGSVTATSLIKSGGTSAQFLKADGSVDSNTYLTSEVDGSITNELIDSLEVESNYLKIYEGGSLTPDSTLIELTRNQITDLNDWTGLGGSLDNQYIDNGANYITSSALTGYATESWVSSNFDNYVMWYSQVNSSNTLNVVANYGINFIAGTNVTLGVSDDANYRNITINASGSSMVYPDAGIAVSTGSSWSTSITDNSANWNSAYTFTSGFSTNYPDLQAIEDISGTSGFLVKLGANTWGLDTNTYLTSNQTITVTGDMEGSGTTSITLTAADDFIDQQSILTLAATDALLVNDATYIGGQLAKCTISALQTYMQNNLDFGNIAWGYITGTLSNQTDLQSAFNEKLSLTGGTLTGALGGTSGSFSSTLTASNFILSSDIRLKKDIGKINNIKEIDNIKFKQFKFINDDTSRKRYGVIAQEVEKIAPEFVYEGDDGYKKVAYIDLLVAKIAALESRIEQLENK